MGGSDTLIASRLGSIAFKLSFTTGETGTSALERSGGFLGLCPGSGVGPRWFI